MVREVAVLGLQVTLAHTTPHILHTLLAALDPVLEVRLVLPLGPVRLDPSPPLCSLGLDPEF